ncbi:DUF4150 domain-containing protein [Mesoterricola silvestris]|uniref:Type VI secretion protein n=1 Tax=Mesoterricola silvestris TaxID=2927979 RepID=A0AA48GQA3_9BACT|nr:DUF4150 domain-containing protein [Mesoterricola silvestris]BDU73735.1 type VI secretion protein [Mesoterricola silvestris]
MFLNCSLSGMAFAFPDVCLTPTPVGPVPIPYPNIVLPPMALPPTTNPRHLVSMMPVHTLATVVPMSAGDNAGVMGGVASAMMMGPARHLMGSVKVFSGGAPVTRMLDPTLQNGTNAAGLSLAPSQTRVLVLS